VLSLRTFHAFLHAKVTFVDVEFLALWRERVFLRVKSGLLREKSTLERPDAGPTERERVSTREKRDSQDPKRGPTAPKVDPIGAESSATCTDDLNWPGDRVARVGTTAKVAVARHDWS
jgi:hypothetical protein